MSDTRAVKKASPDHPVNDLITRRFSPYAFSNEPVTEDQLRQIFEAARWAASSYNEQPWRYIIARHEDHEQFHRVLSCMMDMNQAWAQMAPVIGLGCVTEKFSHNGSPNRVAEHDLGAASASMTVQATSLGLYVHQMAGIHQDKAREVFHIPAGAHAVTGFAIGHLGHAEKLPEGLRGRDAAPRPRRKLAEFVFSDWDKGAGL